MLEVLNTAIALLVGLAGKIRAPFLIACKRAFSRAWSCMYLRRQGRRQLIGLCEYSAFNVICDGNKSKENRANPANQ